MGLKIILTISVVISISGCVSTSEIVPAGKDTYLIAGDDSSWEAISGSMIKTDLYSKANSFCTSKGKKLSPVDESVRSWSAEIRFRCLDESDPEYDRPIMKNVPDITIESK